MILAFKSGLMITCNLISETKTHWNVQAVDENKPRKVEKNDERMKCFAGGVYDAEKWIKGE